MLTKRQGGLLLVMMECDPAYEEEFNRWYSEEHYPERMSCPGFISGKRYMAVEGEPKYLAVYELESPEVLQGEDYKKIAGPSPWTQQLKPHFVTKLRNVYVEIDP